VFKLTFTVTSPSSDDDNDDEEDLHASYFMVQPSTSNLVQLTHGTGSTIHNTRSRAKAQQALIPEASYRSMNSSRDATRSIETSTAGSSRNSTALICSKSTIVQDISDHTKSKAGPSSFALNHEQQQQDVNIVRSEAVDDDYDFVEHQSSRNTYRFRQQGIMIEISPGHLEPFVAHCDNCSDSNFISRTMVERWGWKIRPLPKEHISSYNSIGAEYTPEQYVSLQLRFEGKDFIKESFRIVDSTNVEIIIGAATIERRGITLQEAPTRSAWYAFKRKPTKSKFNYRIAFPSHFS